MWWLIFQDSWFTCHPCSPGGEWYHVMAAIPRLVAYGPFLLSRRWVISCDGCYSKTHGLCAIPTLQLVSDIMWWLLFQDSWLMCHSCSPVGGWYHVMAAIPRLMAYVPFLLLSSGWVISCNGCYSKTHGLCAILALQWVSDIMGWLLSQDSWFMCHSCSPVCEWYHVMAAVPRLIVYVPFLLSSLWVISCDGCYSKTHGLCAISALQAVSDIMWWLLFQDSWFMCHSCSPGGEWYYVMAAIPRLMVYVPFLLSRRWVISCNGCYSKTHGVCVIPTLQTVSDIMWWLLSQDSWFMCHSCSLAGGWYHVMAAIPRLMVYVPFLLSSLWVISCGGCYS